MAGFDALPDGGDDVPAEAAAGEEALAVEPAVAIAQGFDAVSYACAHMTRHDTAQHARKVRGKMRKKDASFLVVDSSLSVYHIVCSQSRCWLFACWLACCLLGLILDKQDATNINKLDVNKTGGKFAKLAGGRDSMQLRAGGRASRTDSSQRLVFAGAHEVGVPMSGQAICMGSARSSARHSTHLMHLRRRLQSATSQIPQLSTQS